MRLVERLGVLHRATTRMLRKRMAEQTDRPYQQLKAMLVISRSTDPCTQTALAEKLMIDAAAASRLVDKLVDEGFVKRCESADRRCVRLAVTRAAARELAIVDQAIEEIEAALVAELGVRRAQRLASEIGQLTDALTEAPALPALRRTAAGARRP